MKGANLGVYGRESRKRGGAESPFGCPDVKRKKWQPIDYGCLELTRGGGGGGAVVGNELKELENTGSFTKIVLEGR